MTLDRKGSLAVHSAICLAVTGDGVEFLAT